MLLNLILPILSILGRCVHHVQVESTAEARRVDAVRPRQAEGSREKAVRVRARSDHRIGLFRCVDFNSIDFLL